MKRGLFYAIITVALFGMSAACNMTKKVDVNGEKIELEDGIYTKMTTNYGDILIKFETELAPMTSANFIMLAEGTHPDVSEEYKGKPYFDGLIFHRVIDGFMIQGGDPQGNGMGGPGYQFPNETSEELTHEKGVISMANSGPNTNGSQFFITVAAPTHLNGGYSVFGKVVEGQAVADSIAKVEKGAQDRPVEDVVMSTVTIIRVGKEYKNWDAAAAFAAGKADFEEAQRTAKEESERKAKEQEALIQANYPNAITTSTGLMYVMHDQGSGEKPVNGQMVNVNYAGYFADGSMFDTSYEELAKEKGQYNPQRPYGPMPMEYGPQARMIPGFAEGIAMLNVGGKATLIIPPHLGYGENGGGPIPPNSWLIFDVELVSIAEMPEQQN